MGQCPDMRLKLETVIKNSKLGAPNSGGPSDSDSNKSSTGGNSSTGTSGGTIKLKTDFSNFSTSSS